MAMRVSSMVVGMRMSVDGIYCFRRDSHRFLFKTDTPRHYSQNEGVGENLSVQIVCPLGVDGESVAYHCGSSSEVEGGGE